MKVCCFGEILLRMTPDVDGKWLRHNSLPVYAGGSELNVANALAIWNCPVKYVTAMPDNSVSQIIKQYVEDRRIDMGSTIFTGNRFGIYYLTPGADLKHTSVIYDRAFSSFTSLEPGQLNWQEILQDVDWLHISAITPALSAQTAKVCLEAVKAAASLSIKISADLNYRSRLWQYGESPIEVMTAIVQYCDVIMGNIWSAEALLGVSVTSLLPSKPAQKDYVNAAKASAQETQIKFPKCTAVANTFRFDHTNDLTYYGTLTTDGRTYVSRQFSAGKILGKVGSGDCFMAGLIYGIRGNLPLQELIDFAAAAGFLKLMEEGDLTNNTLSVIMSTLKDEQ